MSLPLHHHSNTATMATDHLTSIVLHLRSSSDDAKFIDEFQHAGIPVRTVNQLAEAIAVLNVFAHSSAHVFALAPAQQGGIALLELLIDLNILKKVKVILIDPEQDARLAIKALRLGAADYFTDSMDAAEIQARIMALMAKQPDALPEPADRPSDPVRMSPFQDLVPGGVHNDSISINASLRAIRKGDMWVSLSPIEWRLFEELIEHRGKVVNFGELVKRGLNRDTVTASETSLLRLHMSRLRAKLNAHFDRDLNIITLRGRGYMLA
jgi:DNA-binding response OmpR family regulator